MNLRLGTASPRKLQTPNPKPQGISRLQTPILAHVSWSLKFGASLDLGIWSLEFPQISHRFMVGEQFKRTGDYKYAAPNGASELLRYKQYRRRRS